MLNDRLAATRLIFEKLTAMELAIDQALVAAAELTAAAPEARQRARLSPTVGAEAVHLAGEAMATLFAARQKLMQSHAAFAEVRDGMGISPRMTGEAWKLVPPPAAELDQNIRVVAAA